MISSLKMIVEQQPMDILLRNQCPMCESPMRTEVDETVRQIDCPNCHWSRPVQAVEIDNNVPRCCLACGCVDLWRQKDFPQGVGLLLVGAGALLSTIAWAYMMPVLAITILMFFALGDLLLYTFMKDVLVCYRCRAKHSRVNFDDDHPRFNLETAERYRQETLRIEDSQRE